jgi:hypothetical protein
VNEYELDSGDIGSLENAFERISKQRSADSLSLIVSIHCKSTEHHSGDWIGHIPRNRFGGDRSLYSAVRQRIEAD